MRFLCKEVIRLCASESDDSEIIKRKLSPTVAAMFTFIIAPTLDITDKDDSSLWVHLKRGLTQVEGASIIL